MIKMRILEKTIVGIIEWVKSVFVQPCFVLVRKQPKQEYINELTRKERRW